MSSVEIKSVDFDGVRRAMDGYARDLLASRPDIEEIVVFGSFETLQYAPGSDLDVFIVLRDSSQPVRDRIPALMPARFPVPVDVFHYTRAEMRTLTPSLLLDAVHRSEWRYSR